MSTHFKLIKRTNLKKITDKESIPESDLSFVVKDELLQFKLHSEEMSMDQIELKTGIFTIVMNASGGFFLEKSEFVKDIIMDKFVHVEDLLNRVSCFFKNLHKYKEFGIEIPKRAALLYGPAGSGKTSNINKLAQNYSTDGKTCILIWNTDKVRAGDVKRFFKYTDCSKIKQIILIAEDIGGIEADEVRIKSEPSLLALLDNKEKTFKVPIFILATTNHPEIFMGNLTNRPDRFDDKIEVGFPSKEMRIELYKFFKKAELSEKEISLIGDKRCEEFTPAHLREIIIRSAIYDKTTEDVIQDIIKEIEHYKKNFTKSNKLGLGSYYDQ